MLLSSAPLLGGSLGSECSEVEVVVVRSLSRLCCRWPKGVLRLPRPCTGSAPPISLGLRQRVRADRPLPSPCLPSHLALSLLEVHRV